MNTSIPLYAYDGALLDWASEKRVAHLERLGLARVVRHKKGHIARAVMRRRQSDPKPPDVRDYVGTRYSFREHLNDGHVCWRLRALGKRSDTELAPAELRPIFLRVMFDCLLPVRE